jgi:selenium metabolism protein YedF
MIFLYYFCCSLLLTGMRIVDTKGQLCPAPLIATRKVLKEASEGESFIVLTDNQVSFNNICRYLKDNRTTFHATEAEGIWTLQITRTSASAPLTDAEEYCNTSVSHFRKGNFIVVISSDKMGQGDDELGHLLMTNFIKSLKDLENLPQRIIFYNSGVRLAVKDSPTIEILSDLEKMGVELLLCSTCVSHYGLNQEISTGTFSNMFVIAELMASAGNIVKP